MFILLLAIACSGGDPEPVAVAPADFDDPATCAECHAPIVEEWSHSMHALSHHDRDPIYGAMRRLRIEKQGIEVGAQCPACHNPRSPDDPDAPAGLHGVSCASCHAVTAVDAGKGPGANALTFSPDTLLGVHDVSPGATPAHGTGPAAAHLVDGTTICLACHDATTTPTGAAACTTGPEYALGASTLTCVQCHMPRAIGPSGTASSRGVYASHIFAGPHRAWRGDPSLLASSLGITADLTASRATVTLVNVTGHAFPTGFPGRMAAVVVRGFDASGAEIWTSLGPDGAPTPEALLNKVYVDAGGNPVPSAFSTSLAHDRRLKPGESRTIGFDVPDGVVRIEAQVRFHLMSPKLAATLGLADAPEAKPQVFATAEATAR